MVGSKVSVLLNTATHKLRFPKSDEPLPWLHHCEKFFWVVRTTKTEKVWLPSFYMEGATQQWY
jgi:hypothetical protein